MISEAELRRLAGAWNVDFTVVERDYVLSWVLIVHPLRRGAQLGTGQTRVRRKGPLQGFHLQQRRRFHHA